MGSGFTKGGRDFLELGTWNLMCAYCGRKRKANELVTDDEFARKMWCCPEHADQRHPQEYARGIPEHMSVPKVQPPILAFVSLNAGFPLSIIPNPVTLFPQGEVPIVTEAGSFLTTEGGSDLVTEVGSYGSVATAILPPWIAPGPGGDPGVVFVESFAWSWRSGGANIAITTPNSLSTQLTTTVFGSSGILQVVVVNSLGQTSIAYTTVAVGGSITADGTWTADSSGVTADA